VRHVGRASQPLRVRTLADTVVFTFAAVPGGRATFFLQPDAVASSSGAISIIAKEHEDEGEGSGGG